MPSRIEEQPLSRPITTKLSERDYQNLLARVIQEKTNQTTLVRDAIRCYLKSGNSEPSPAT